MHRAVISVFLVTAFTSSVGAQEYVPIATSSQDEKAADSLAQLGVSSYRDSFLKARVNLLSPNAQPFDPLKCLNPPKISDLKTQISNRTMSASRAASLGFGVGSLSASSNSTVFIQDWTRSARCLSQDGKTQLIWGQAVRIVASISDVDANASLTLASIAAQATLNNKSSNLEASLIGVSDPESQVLATSLLGPLNVENFNSKSTIIQALTKKVIEGMSDDMGLIGVVQDAPELRSQVAAAFALSQISQGKTCQNAKSRIGDADTKVSGAIEATYISVTGTCGTSAPSQGQRSIANDNLLGLKVSN